MRSIKKALAIIAATGFIFMIGTAGASDNNTISDNQLYKQAIISMVMFVGSFLGIRAIEKRQILAGKTEGLYLTWDTDEIKIKEARRKEKKHGQNNQRKRRNKRCSVFNYWARDYRCRVE